MRRNNFTKGKQENFKKVNGFTLIELLAVIVILAFIALIATLIIMNVINDSKKGAAKDSGYAIIKAAELMSAKAEFELPVNYTENDELNYKGTRPTKMSLKIESNGTTTFTAFIDGYCVVKRSDTSEVTIDDTKKTAEICVLGANSNIVVDVKDGLIPVILNENGTVKKADANNWFDYDTKQWANAVSVTATTRNTYQIAAVGAPIDTKDILGYFVYIPRYKYQLWNVENGVSEPQEIKIEFEKKSTAKSNGTKNSEWLTHPAFTFGTDELNGIWVGKFETTGTAAMPTVLPGEKSLTNQNISTAFNMIQKIKSDAYGLSSYDTHMMKNMEWGAVTYLSHSKYGKNGEIWINNVKTSNLESITGCSGTSASASAVNNATACPTDQEYNKNGINASTTGNITGIYDMSGGVWERTMGVMLDTASNPIYSSSGFTEATMPDKKYYDTYQTTTGNFDFAKGKLGDSTREIVRTPSGGSAGWYSDYSFLTVSSGPWFSRGGYAHATGSAGVFGFYISNGDASAGYGSRVVAVH